MRYLLALLILLGCNFTYTRDWFLDSPSAVEPVEQDIPLEEVGRQFINAAFTLDVEAARNLTCAARRGEITEPSESDIAALADIEFDISGLEFTITDQTDDSATLTISGMLRAESAGQEMEIPIETMLGSDTSVPMVKEDGQWLVCPND
jgi:hypothetical protein